MRGGRPAGDVKALTFDNNRTELARVSTRRLETTESGQAQGTKRGAQPTSADKVGRAKALLESGELGIDPDRLAEAIIDRTIGQDRARRISLMTESTPLADRGRQRASLDTVALALANVDLDGLRAAEGDLAAAVDELALDPRLRRDRPGVEPAK